jgi:hypothetical protein
MSKNYGLQFATLGLFIIDEFEFRDEEGNPTDKAVRSQAGNFVLSNAVAEKKG